MKLIAYVIYINFMLTGVKSRGKPANQEPVQTMAGQAASRATIDTWLGFR